MAYDEKLAQRVTSLLADRPGFAEKRMFGGICYLIRGNMACGVLNDELIIRVGPERHAEFLKQPHIRPFDITGRIMRGWVMVGPDGHRTADDFSAWIERGVAFAATLPAK